MRLIDADALLDQYGLKDATKYGNKDAEQQAHSYSTLMLYEIADMIEDAPTAYDVEKVVSELENIKTGGDCRHKCKYYDWSVGACEGHCEDYVRERAIEIVRKGGVE